jgi:hypothetical protein
MGRLHHRRAHPHSGGTERAGAGRVNSACDSGRAELVHRWTYGLRGASFLLARVWVAFFKRSERVWLRGAGIRAERWVVVPWAERLKGVDG